MGGSGKKVEKRNVDVKKNVKSEKVIKKSKHHSREPFPFLFRLRLLLLLLKSIAASALPVPIFFIN